MTTSTRRTRRGPAAGARGEATAAAVGSVVGAGARWLIGTWADAAGDAWPWTTLVVNLLGCLAIGVLAGVVTTEPGRTFVVVGVLGGFTTMSAFAVEATELADAGREAVAASYVAVSVIGGLTAFVAGRSLERLTEDRRGPTERAGEI